MRLNFQVRLYPNKTMKKVLDSLCDYRRYCWNQGLDLWDTLYDARLIGMSDELRAKIKASLTDKTIQFSEEEQALIALFPAPSENKIRDELVAQKPSGNSSFLHEFYNRLLKIWQPHGISFSTIQKQPTSPDFKVVRNQNKALRPTKLESKMAV